jgi:NADH-quinone oxidoreductase subunit F
MTANQQTHISEDERYTAIERIMARFNYQQDALLEVLNSAQESFGYLPEGLLRHVSHQLDVPLSQIYGVATFYHMYTLEPTGDHHCFVCTDPACAIAGGEDVLTASRRYARSTAQGTITVERATCLGLCDQAPAALDNGTAYVNLSADDITALFSGQSPRPRLQVTGEPRILTRLIGRLDPSDLEGHREHGAFSALETALHDMSPDAVIEAIKESGLAGRGGAGFSTGLKWEFTRTAEGAPKYVICNFDESEPGTFKDRTLMQGDPFRALEGVLLCGYAIGAEQGYVFIRGEYQAAAQTVQEAIDALYSANLLGQHILGTDFSFDLEIRRGAGAYICGEETALFEAIEGKRGNPRSKPPFPTTHGLFGKPTAINNVETLAIVPDLVLNGGAWLRQWGTEKSVGVKLFCLSGHVNRPGVVEAPYGITVRALIEQFGGGFVGEPQAILMGGAAGGLLPPEHFDVPLTNETLNPLGAPIGSGVIMVFNQDVNLLQILKTLARFFVHETCGQCMPCRLGTNQIHTLLGKIADGNGSTRDLEKLDDVCQWMRAITLCGLGQTAPSAVISALRYFRHDFESLIQSSQAAELRAG